MCARRWGDMPANDLDLKVEINRLRETQAATERIIAGLHGEPMVQAMQRATLLVQRNAKINAPVDTGRLRASITPEIRARDRSVIGVVGSNVVYAPFQEERVHYLEGAIEQSADDIVRLLGDAVGRIVTY